MTARSDHPARSRAVAAIEVVAAIEAAGWGTNVERLPDGGNADLLARITPAASLATSSRSTSRWSS